MYAHPDCVYLDETFVRRMFADRNVEIVAGDIVQTVHEIKNKPVVLAFVGFEQLFCITFSTYYTWQTQYRKRWVVGVNS